MVMHEWVEGMVHASDARTLGQISASVETWLSGPHCVRKYWKKLEVAVAALAVRSGRVV